MQFDQLNRREFSVLVSGAGAASLVLPFAARAQQSAMPVIGFLNGTSQAGYGQFLAAFLEALSESGYVENQNVAIEYRWADGHYDRLPSLAADLVQRKVNVIAATSTPANRIAAAATKTIPVIFTTSSNPVALGLVASLNRPGGNVTGAATLNVDVGPKRLELLNQMVPSDTIIGVLVNPSNPNVEAQSRGLQAAARSFGRQVLVVNARTEDEIDAAFARFKQERAGAAVINTDAFFFNQRDQLIALTRRHAIPTVFDRREYTEAGGLASYGGSVTEVYRLAGIYTARILKGEKPADLPVQRATRVELVINLKTARELGIAFPLALLGRADKVIE